MSQAIHPRRFYIGTTAERGAVSLPIDANGATWWDTDFELIYIWTSTAWIGTHALTSPDGLVDQALNIDNDGDVGIGTITPQTKLQLHDGGFLPSTNPPSTWPDGITVSNTGGDTDTADLVLIAGNIGSSNIHFGDVIDGDIGNISYDHSNNSMAFVTNGSQIPLTLTSTGKAGIGTSVVPHGSIGAAILALEGTNGSTSGPHIQVTTASDDYPLLQMLNWAHDNMGISFDAYYDGAWKSSDIGSNFQIYKFGDLLSIKYDSGIAQGSAITWNDGIVLDTSGNVGISQDTPNYRLDVVGGVSTSIRFGSGISDDGGFLTSTNAGQAILSGGASFNGTNWVAKSTGAAHVETTATGNINFDTDSGLTVGNTYAPTQRMRITSAGVVHINDIDNADMTIGLTINQEDNNDDALDIKSSLVAHGMTAIRETDTYCSLRKISSGGGGAHWNGFTEVIQGFIIGANVTTEDTTKTTSSEGAIILRSQKKSGTGVGSMGSNANMVVMLNDNTIRWILDAEGDIFYGGSDDGTITDHLDDALLLSGFRAVMSPKESPAYRRFKGFISETEDILVRQGVLTAPLKEGGLVSDTALKGLLIDGLLQVNERLNKEVEHLTRTIEEIYKRLRILEEVYGIE